MNQQQQEEGGPSMFAAITGYLAGRGPDAWVSRQQVTDNVMQSYPNRWKSSSFSSALSYLGKLGCLDEKVEGGTYYCRFRSMYDDKARSRFTTLRSGYAKRGRKKQQEAVPSARVLVTLEVGENQTLTVSSDEARSLYDQLRAFFGRAV